MIDLFVSALITFFVIIDPPGNAPIFASLTTGATSSQRRSMAFRAILISAIILVFFAVLGEELLGALHISLDAFRIAGGLMLFAIAFEMVFEKRNQRREDRAQKVNDAEIEDVSAFPMAMPMIAGPGTIAAVMLLQARSNGLQESLVVMGALAVVLLSTLLALLGASPLMRLLGQRIEAVVTRLLGVVLAALAAQFVIDGLIGAFAINVPATS